MHVIELITLAVRILLIVLYLDTPAQRAAMIYSLFGTYQINNINPYEWLKIF